MAQVKHLLEITVSAADPVAEINNVIFALLQLHPQSQAEILSAVHAEIDRALSELESGKEGAQ